MGLPKAKGVQGRQDTDYRNGEAAPAALCESAQARGGITEARLGPRVIDPWVIDPMGAGGRWLQQRHVLVDQIKTGLETPRTTANSQG